MQRVLLIQTAFIGDAILGTAAAMSIKAQYPNAVVYYLVRKGNEDIVRYCPAIDHVWAWDKKQGKYRNLWGLLRKIKQERFDAVFNFHRYTSSALLTAFSGAKVRAGFANSPFPYLLTHKAVHHFGDGTHETERNHQLLSKAEDFPYQKPHLDIPEEVKEKIRDLEPAQRYITISPISVWPTKQFPSKKWVEFLSMLPEEYAIYFLGSPSDREACYDIATQIRPRDSTVLAGNLSLIESAAMMTGAVMNYANDSGPVHLASAVNAPMCEVFGSTVPSFGFTPLSDRKAVVEIGPLYCRPCGMHGKRKCPEGHFRCMYDINVFSLVEALETKPS